MAKQVRILAVTSVDGIEYQPNDVVDCSVKTAKLLCDAGSADGAPEAIKYCVSELDAKVKSHTDKAESK